MSDRMIMLQEKVKGKGKAVLLRGLGHRMVVRLSALCTSRIYLQEILPAPISVRG
jgi:hypothetical protein